jgi:hypothetical protein
MLLCKIAIRDGRKFSSQCPKQTGKSSHWLSLLSTILGTKEASHLKGRSGEILFTQNQTLDKPFLVCSSYSEGERLLGVVQEDKWRERDDNMPGRAEQRAIVKLKGLGWKVL